MINCKEKNNKLLKIIKSLEFENIDEEKFYDESEMMYNSYFNDDEKNNIVVIPYSDICNGGQEFDEYFYIIYVKRKKSEKEEFKNQIIEKIKRKIEDEKKDIFNNTNKIYLIEIFDSLKQKSYISNIVEYSKCIRNKVKEELKNKDKIFSLTNIEYVNFIIPDIQDHKEIIEIKIKDRIRSLEQEYKLYTNNDNQSDPINKEVSEDNNIIMNCYVFTAELNSLINLYDIYGDNLFDKNIRVGGVRDNVGVDKNIKNTYINNPEEFWFLNNGISLLIEAKEQINLSNFDRIKFTVEDIENISIINGAQTIKAVSDTYKDDNKINPYVILRIYLYQKTKNFNSNCIKEANKKFRDFAERVTISLNTQKPILLKDLAYLTYFVKKIQELKLNFVEENIGDQDYAFEFVRRGEIPSIILCQYQLDTFAKIVKSYLFKEPGTARNATYSKLLKLRRVETEDTNLLKLEDEVFINELQNDNLEEDFTEAKKIFFKKYKPVNFAFKLKNYLEELVDNSKSNFKRIIDNYIEKNKVDDNNKEKLYSFEKYGIYFIISFIINLLNENNEDFYNWKYTTISENENTNDKELKIEVLEDKIHIIIDSFLKCSFGDNNINDSNGWKTNEVSKTLFNQLKNK